MSYRHPFERPATSITDDDIDDIDFLFQNSSMNLFGRSFKETLADFPKIGGRQKRDYRASTPSLTSDDTRSPSSTSSYGLATPSPIRSDYTASPPSSPIRSRATRTHGFSESVAARPSYDLPPVRREDSVMRTFGPDTYRSRTPPVERQPTPFKESKMVIDIHDPIEEEDEEEEDKSDDDDYKARRPALVPTPSKPVGRKRVPKQTGEFECAQCPKTFTRNFDRKRHVQSIHGKPSESDILLRTCNFCDFFASRVDACQRHMEHYCSKNPDAEPETTSKAQEQHAVKKKADKPRPKATIGKGFRGSNEVRC